MVTEFEPTVEGEITAGLDHESILAALDSMARPGTSSFAVRLDGRFASVRARSVPRQSPPYRALAEVVADQHVFELTDVEGSMVGFRFPAYIEGIEVAGYHLHFVDAERRRGGHVLGSRSGGPLRVRIDPSDDLHIELPPAVDLADPDLAAATHAGDRLGRARQLPRVAGSGRPSRRPGPPLRLAARTVDEAACASSIPPASGSSSVSSRCSSSGSAPPSFAANGRRRRAPRGNHRRRRPRRHLRRPLPRER